MSHRHNINEDCPANWSKTSIKSSYVF